MRNEEDVMKSQNGKRMRRMIGRSKERWAYRNNNILPMLSFHSCKNEITT